MGKHSRKGNVEHKAAQAARLEEWRDRYLSGQLLPGEAAFYPAKPSVPNDPTLIQTSDGTRYGVTSRGEIVRAIERLPDGSTRKLRPLKRRVLLRMAKARLAAKEATCPRNP